MKRLFLFALLFACLSVQAQETPEPEVAPVEETAEVVAPEEGSVPAPEAPAPVVVPETTPVVADTAEELQTEDVGSVLNHLADAAHDGNILLVVALSLTILVWVVRTFLWKTLRSDLLPYITVAVSGVSGFAGAVVLGKGLVGSLLVGLGGVLAGLAAVGSWEVGKPALRRKKKKTE